MTPMYPDEKFGNVKWSKDNRQQFVYSCSGILGRVLHPCIPHDYLYFAQKKEDRSIEFVDEVMA